MNTEDLHRNCIAFGEWILKSPYTHGYDGTNTFFWWDINTDECVSTEELFQIYLKTLNNE